MAEEIDLDHAPRPLSLPFLGDYNGLPVVSIELDTAQARGNR
jgi:hypothetical protein